MNAILWSSSRYMRLKRLQPACNKPTLILTARWIVCASTNAEFMPLVRRVFMWATYLHGSWTTGTGWDGIRHSILGKSLLSIEKKKQNASTEFLKRRPGGMATQTFVGRPHARDQWAHLHCPFNIPNKRMNPHRSPRCARRTPL